MKVKINGIILVDIFYIVRDGCIFVYEIGIKDCRHVVFKGKVIETV